jgi:ubiquinone/menaquinone biosynthesis C-methylase UbiE
MEYNFDRVSNQYDATRGMPGEVAERICRWVRSRLPADPAVTEVGAGTGRIGLPFIQQGVRYTGIDISEQMLGRFRAKLGGSLQRGQLLVADLHQEIPLPGQSQDAVLAVHILHLTDAGRAMPHIRQILKPHGALVWGYEHHDELSPRFHIRQHFRATAAALGFGQWRDFTVPAARRLLAEWGARESRHMVAVWPEQETCRQALDAMRERTLSFTWEMPDDVLAEAARRTEAWARAQYGDLDRVFALEKRFMVDWYQLERGT